MKLDYSAIFLEGLSLCGQVFQYTDGSDPMNAHGTCNGIADPNGKSQMKQQ